MADATAILAVSRALQGVLQAGLEIVNIAANQIVIESIDLLPSPVPVPRVTIFLYNIHEDPFLKNQDASLAPALREGMVNVTAAPITLDLDYMICAWASTTPEEHLLLGDILRVFHDQAEIGPHALGASWAPDESIQISLANPTIEDQARIWATFGFKRFKLSLYYKVRVVPIASRRAFNEARIVARDAELHTIAPLPAGDLPAGVG